MTRCPDETLPSPLLDEASRPHVLHPSTEQTTPAGLASARTLVEVHDHLRHELAQIQQAMAGVANGQLDAASARSLINRMSIRQNAWALGSFCAQYCRIVTLHHTIEDRRLFPDLEREDSSLSEVLTRLADEHEIIAEVLERFDGTLVLLLNDPAELDPVRRLADDLNNALLSHLAYEEQELLGPISRSSILV